MSHAALGALGIAAFALTSQNIWSLADQMSVLRLVALMLTSVALTTVVLVVADGLWERTSDPAARERVVLFNLSTAVTLAFGTAALHLALFDTAIRNAVYHPRPGHGEIRDGTE
jgi:uncharacterized membrane protein